MPDTFCLLKPDAVRRRLVPTLLQMIEVQGLDVVRMKLTLPDRARVEEHYCEHREWEGFARLVEFTCSGNAVAMVLSARSPDEDAVRLLRDLMGPFRPPWAWTTIRARFMLPGGPDHENLIHGSDSAESARREIDLWFGSSGEGQP